VNTAKAFSSALFRAKRILEPKVNNILETSGWPKEVTSQISLVSTRTSIGVYYPAHLTEQIENLEFGSPTTPPSWTLRRIDELIDAVVAEEVQAEYVNFIFSEDVLL
jgi:hypothetical protein